MNNVLEKPCCYILGTGKSLLALSHAEKLHLNQHPRTLAMNRFYLHHEKLDILPKALFLSDFNFHADLILRNCIERLHDEQLNIPYYVNQEYLQFYRSPFWAHRRLKKRRLRHLRKRGDYHRTPLRNYANLQPINVSNEARRFRLANNLQQQLYHRRGSLTVAVNLMHILYPRCDIKLLGIDLSDHGYFYDNLITEKTRNTWVDEKYTIDKNNTVHPNARPTPRDSSTLVDSMRMVTNELHQRGISVSSCNADSLLVTEGIMPASDVC